MKKIIFPICTVSYLIFVTLTIKPTPKKYSLKFILGSIGAIPKDIMVVLSLIIGVLTIAIIENYICAKEKGKKDGK